MIVTLTRRSKRNHFSSYFQDNIHNLKKIWQGINSIIANSKSKSSSVSSIYVNENHDISSDPITISNKFNDYFYNVAENARSKIPYSSKHFSEFLKNSNDSLVEKHAPLHKLTQKQVKTLCKPWITKGIQIAIHKRNKLQKLFLNSKDPKLKKSYELEFKRYRNMIVSLTRKSKRNHFSSYFQDNIHNIKKIWQGINSRPGRKRRANARARLRTRLNLFRCALIARLLFY